MQQVGVSSSAGAGGSPQSGISHRGLQTNRKPRRFSLPLVEGELTDPRFFEGTFRSYGEELATPTTQTKVTSASTSSSSSDGPTPVVRSLGGAGATPMIKRLSESSGVQYVEEEALEVGCCCCPYFYSFSTSAYLPSSNPKFTSISSSASL